MKIKKRGNGHEAMNVTGLDELVKELAELATGEEVKVAVAEALADGAKIVGKQMQEEMAKHTRPNGKGWSTGATYKSYVDEPVRTKGTKVAHRVGYNVKKGGLAAIFWQLGGAHIEPTMFMTKAADDNINEVLELQRRAIQRALDKKLGG